MVFISPDDLRKNVVQVEWVRETYRSFAIWWCTGVRERQNMQEWFRSGTETESDPLDGILNR